MRAATLNADLDSVLETIDEVAKHDVEAAAALRGLANGYRYDELLALLGTET
jgi:hypothetical protein